MPMAFGLGFQNNFHLLSVNWWQPWELGVKAPIYQPSFALWCWAFWNVHFRFLALHSGLRMGLVFLNNLIYFSNTWNSWLIKSLNLFVQLNFLPNFTLESILYVSVQTTLVYRFPKLMCSWNPLFKEHLLASLRSLSVWFQKSSVENSGLQNTMLLLSHFSRVQLCVTP